MQLNHEIDWLAPEKIRASGVTIEKLQAAHKAEEEHVQNELVSDMCMARTQAS
jgi:hypothetical protein